MPYPITIPRLGWSMEEGVLSEWLKAPGDFVRAGDMIFVLEGEKAANEIESFDSGTLCIPADAPRPGTTVKVGETIGFLLSAGEQAPTSVRVAGTNTSTTQPPSPGRSPGSATVPTRPKDSAASAISSVPRVAGPAARRLARALGIDLNTISTPDPTGRVLREDVQRAAQQRAAQQRADLRSSGIDVRHAVATPRAKRRARELGIDWTRLVGTGRGGRIREQDVPTAQPDCRLPTADSPLPLAPGRFVPASKLRQVIAQRMMTGVHEAAPVTLTTKVDADVLVAYRERLRADATDGVVPSYNDILIQCVAHTLREHPELNACWYRNGVHYYDAVHIATAVDTPDGLLAPVVRDANRLTLRAISEQTRQLIALARSGRLSGTQLASGTFTISNLGSLGVDAFTPILNLQQAGILGIGRIVDEPVVRNGQVVAGKTITLSLTFDHRVIDGAPAARWLQRLGERVQAVDRLEVDRSIASSSQP